MEAPPDSLSEPLLDEAAMSFGEAGSRSPREADTFPGHCVWFHNSEATKTQEFNYTNELEEILKTQVGEDAMRWIAFTGHVHEDWTAALRSELMIPPSLLMNAISDGDMHSMSGSSIIVNAKDMPPQVDSFTFLDPNNTAPALPHSCISSSRVDTLDEFATYAGVSILPSSVGPLHRRSFC